MLRVLVVDDHTILRQGIAGLIKSQEGFDVVAEAGSGSAAVRLALDLKPDVIIMDMSLPDFDGIEAARRMKEQGCVSEIVFLTMHNDPGLCEAAARIGARGYLLKDDAMDDLLYAIKAVLRKERFSSASLRTERAEAPAAVSPLTRREEEVVSLIADGMTSRGIADKLCISVKTVETHRSHIMEKLRLKNAADLIKYAIRSGLAR